MSTSLSWQEYGDSFSVYLALIAYFIGLLYYKGLVLPRSPYHAAHWLRISADQDFSDAQYLLATMYEEGLGVHKDLKEAAELYIPAANGGHADAQYNLGFLYENGRGVERDLVEAYKWFKLASYQRDLPFSREKLIHQMTREQMEEGERRIHLWKRMH